MDLETDSNLTAFLHSQMPFTALLGLSAVSASRDEVVLTAEWREDLCTTGAVVHGGYLISVADTAGATCAVFNLSEGATTATIESKTNMFRAVTEGTMVATAVPVHVGRSTIVVQTDITRADGKLAARTTQTQAVITP
ncbi:MAG: PaaI family thioesterase [Ilumatobacteraceae bacterium]